MKNLTARYVIKTAPRKRLKNVDVKWINHAISGLTDNQ